MDALPARAAVVIVGGGFAGTATAWWLAQRGVTDVVVLEREDLLGLHASGRNAGLCRQLAEDDRWTELCVRGARFLRSPPGGFAARPPVTVTGGLLLADDLGTIDALVARARRHGVAHAAIGAAEVTTRVPAAAGLACAGAVWVPDDGVIDATALLHGLAAGARRAGARIVVRADVEAVSVTGRDVDVVTGRGAVRARVVVCAAGAWAGGVGGLAGSRAAELVPQKRHLFFLAQAPDGPALGEPFVWHVGAAELYVRHGADGVLASACDGATTAPGDVRVDPDARDRLAARLAPAPALARRAVTATWACQRTFAPEGAPRIGWDRDVPWLYWVAGLGGHGATAAAAVGEEAAAAIVDRIDR
jgi:D-arginine dehydrogenase